VRKEFVAGETFLRLGQAFRLELVARLPECLRFTGSRFELARSARTRARDLFVTWYVTEARAHLVDRVAALAQAMGIRFRRIAVRRMRYRWASISPRGTISFSWRIMQAPPVVVDYLVVHELAHVLEPHHSAEFWNIVAVHAPAAAQARAWLKRHGGRLEW
jgi:predicted metal-dependent hydrolase